MLSDDFRNTLTATRHYYIKRKLIKDEALIYNGSIFPSSENQEVNSLMQKDDLNKFQTVTTNIDHSITIQSNNEDDISNTERKVLVQKPQPLPRIHAHSQLRYSRHQNQRAKSCEVQTLKPKPKEKVLNSHISDPFYLKLQKTVAKRINESFNRYKRGWIDASLRRKGKSVIERSIQKAATSIEDIHNDTMCRKTKVTFTTSLRNNNQEFRFVFPAKIRPDIQGLKGKGGGKVIPITTRSFRIEQVYMCDRGGQQN